MFRVKFPTYKGLSARFFTNKKARGVSREREREIRGRVNKKGERENMCI